MAAQWNRSRRDHVFAFGILLVLVTVATTLAAWANPPADDGWYTQVRSWTIPSVLTDADVVRSVPFIALLALLGLAGWRCRALLAGYLLALVGSFGIAWGLSYLVARPRPYDSAVAGTDSFPSLTVTMLTVVAVMVPVAFGVLTRSTVVEAAVAVPLFAVVALAGLQEVNGALRWPLDVAGGLLVAGAVTAAVLAAVEQPSDLHARCLDCRWQRGESAVASAVGEHHGGAAHPLFRAAVVWTALLVLGFGYIAWTQGIPRTPESGVMGTGLEVPLNIGLVVLILVGLLVAVRWHVTGAVMVALAAVLLGYAASVQYAPGIAAALTALAFVPALLLWVQWHRVASVKAALALATTTSLLLGGMIYFASSNYSTYWGPSHPTSATPAPAQDVVDWMWAGAVSDTGMTVKARTEDDVDQVRLAVSPAPELTTPVYSDPVASEARTQNVVSLSIDGLDPDRDYYYALELDGEIYTERVGHVATFPRGPSSFTFAVSSCSRTGSKGQVYDAVRLQEPLLFINDGDWFYGDIDQNDRGLFRRQYDANLASPSQSALYASTAFAYVWDDHDYGGNDADGSSASRPAVMDVYRQYVPHYPLRGDDAPVFQSFTVGDVRFVMTDARSARVPASGDEPGTMFGPEQLDWLTRELSRADRYGLVVWVQGAPWIDAPDPTSDTWASFPEERRTIAEAIARHDVDNLLMISGDAHMLAYDDGTHTDYSESGEAGFPLFHAAALDRKASQKGGPYTGPVRPGGGQFGTVDVRDDGTDVQVTLTARTWDERVLFTKRFTVSRDD